MKIKPVTTAGVVLVLAALATVAFLYGVPSGRHARREALRALRLTRNAVGIYPLPVLTVKMWGGGEPGVLIELYESGRLVVSRPGEKDERHLTPDVAKMMVESAEAALASFNGRGCGTKPGGINAELYVLINGSWVGSICRDATDWPRGFETVRLLAEIRRHVPGVLQGVAVDERESSAGR